MLNLPRAISFGVHVVQNFLLRLHKRASRLRSMYPNDIGKRNLWDINLEQNRARIFASRTVDSETT